MQALSNCELLCLRSTLCLSKVIKGTVRGSENTTITKPKASKSSYLALKAAVSSSHTAQRKGGCQMEQKSQTRKNHGERKTHLKRTQKMSAILCLCSAWRWEPGKSGWCTICTPSAQYALHQHYSFLFLFSCSCRSPVLSLYPSLPTNCAAVPESCLVHQVLRLQTKQPRTDLLMPYLHQWFEGWGKCLDCKLSRM